MKKIDKRTNQLKSQIELSRASASRLRPRSTIFQDKTKFNRARNKDAARRESMRGGN